MTLSGAERLYLRRAGLVSSRLLHAITHVIQVREEALKRGEKVRTQQAVNEALVEASHEDYDAVDEAWEQGHKDGVGEGWHDGWNDALDQVEERLEYLHREYKHVGPVHLCRLGVCGMFHDFDQYTRSA